jgi:hypothetical protein
MRSGYPTIQNHTYDTKIATMMLLHINHASVNCFDQQNVAQVLPGARSKP